MANCRECGGKFDHKHTGRRSVFCFPCRKARHERQVKAWKDANQARIKAKATQWRAANRDRLLEKNRLYMRKYRARKLIDKLIPPTVEDSSRR
jgi:hypothetical protein